MKKSLLAMLFAVALVVPAVAENMWIGGSLGYSNTDVKDADSVTSWTIEPEFGYSVDEKLDIGIDLGYSYEENAWEAFGIQAPVPDTVTTIGIAPFVRYKIFSIGSFDFLAKGSIFYASAKADASDAKIDAYGIKIAPVVTYSINETWSIGATLDFAELGFTHAKGDEKAGDMEVDEFGFNLNDGSLISIGFSYHF